MTVNLDLVHIRRGPSDDKYVWTPFAVNDEFNAGWWDSPPYLFDDPHYVRADSDGVEVAKIEFNHDFRGSKQVGAPKLGAALWKSSAWRSRQLTADAALARW